VTGDLATAEAMLRRTCGARLRTSFPMALLTTFRIGGPAALYLELQDDGDLDSVSAAVLATGVPTVVLGKGSNVLVADAGFPGIVLRLGRGYRWVAREGDRLQAGGAMALPALAGVAFQHALGGLEFAVAIPASLGGAVRMNAGAHGGAMGDVVESVDVHDLATGERRSIDAEGAGFTYRGSAVSENGLVVGAICRLRGGDPMTIRAAMDEARAWRRATQPLAEPNCGSVFTNPPGDHAARLIEAAGMKGLRIGGAHVSEKHANFIVAGSGSSAADVRALIEAVRTQVLEATGIRLETEVRLVGMPADG